MAGQESKFPRMYTVLEFTRQRQFRRRLASVLMLAVVACDSSVAPAPRKAATLERLTPGNLTGIVATDISPAPAVIIKDQNGVPLAGIAVEFAATGGGTLQDQSISTNAEGVASAGQWTLGTRAGQQVLTVRSAGLAPVSFTTTALAGPPSVITPVEGNHQVGLVGAELATPLSVQLTDAFSNLIAGAPVIFTVVGGDGTIAGQTAVTSGTGFATSGAWTLGSGGPQQVSARSQSAEFVFDALACVKINWGCDDGDNAEAVIVFVREGQLFRAAVDNPKPVQITSGGLDYNPTWSPDGSRVAFVRYDQGHTNIFILSADGRLTQRTTDGGYGSPAWSPDGRKLAVTRWGSPPDPGIYVMSAEADGKPALRLTTGWAPTWSPDGSRLVFTDDWSIGRVNADGTGLTQLLKRTGYGTLDDAAWSPDGRSVAVAVSENCDFDDDCDTAIGVLDLGASNVHVVVRGARGRFYARQPTWSPDGSTIAFSSYSCGTTGCSEGVSTIGLDGTGERVIIPNGGSPSWRR